MSWYEPIGRLPDPTHEEFSKWVTAQEAFAHLLTGVTPSLSAALQNRLRNGVLFGAASMVKFEEDGVQKTLYRVSIDPAWWANVEGGLQRHYDLLWAHGDITLIVPGRGGDPATTVHFFGVKFEYAGIRDATPAQFRLTPVPPPAPAVAEIPQSPIPPRSIARAPAAPTPEPEVENGNDISEEEYDRWYEPREVIAALPQTWAEHTKIRTVADLMRDGLIRAVAAEMGGWDKPVERFELPKEIWEKWPCQVDHDFWTAGKREIFSDHSDYDGPPFRAYRVRLDPEGVHKRLSIPQRAISDRREREAMPAPTYHNRGALLAAAKEARQDGNQAPQTAIASESGPAPSLPPMASEAEGMPDGAKPPKVPPKEVRDWYRVQFAENPGLAFHEVEALAAAHFRPRRVTRQPLRDAIGELNHTQTQGNPAFRRK
ncbi:MAG: hypothetical protein V4597_18430 [Pseudomonadota bacterium]